MLLVGLSASFSAQEQQKKRPKLKQFGSSLDRLKWDPTTKHAVEKNRSSKSTKSPEEDVVRVQTDLVSTDLLVVDQTGRPVDSLTAHDLIVLEDGQPQKIAHFQRGDGASIPRSIVLIIDYGCSQLAVLRRSIDAAKLMVDKLEPQDVMAIVTDDVELVTDFTNDKTKLKRKLEEIYRRPNTVFDPTVVTDWNWHIRGKGLQLSALMVTLKEAFIEEDLRPIIVFQTNATEAYELRDPIVSGGPPPDIPDDFKAEELKRIERRAKYVRDKRQSDFSLADVYRAVEKSRVTIYTVIPEYRYLNRPSGEQVRLRRRELENAYDKALADSKLWGDYREAKDRLLKQQERWRVFSPTNLLWDVQQRSTVQEALITIASKSGGSTQFLESAEDAEGIYNRILSDINSRYVVAYYPSNKIRDGGRRKIEFSIKGHPDYHIIGRRSYLAPVD